MPSSRSQARKPKEKKHTFKELSRLRDDFIAQRKKEGTPDALRVLDIYRAMRTTEDGEARTSLSQQIEVLGCKKWQQILRCISTGLSSKEHVKVCRRRFLCLNCHKWKLQVQAERWFAAIKNALRFHDSCLGPLIQFRWDIPKADPRASLASFDNFINKTLTGRLKAEGISTNQYIICRTFDPVECAARLVYAGPPSFTDLSLRVYKEPISHKSVKPPLPPSEGGRPCLWDNATDFGQSYLLNSDAPIVGEHDSFERTLRLSLYWCVGNSESLLHLTREQVWRTYAQFNHTRMFATRGLIYEGKSDWRTELALDPPAGDPAMMIEKQYRDDSVEMVLRDPLQVIGPPNLELSAPGAERLCPHCGKPWNSPGHEIDGEPFDKNAGDDDDAPATPPAKVH